MPAVDEVEGRIDTLEGAAAWGLMQGRTAAKQGGFFLPYLKSGMRLLDAGCGGGSITLGLADIVAPGEVEGLDANGEQIQAATKLASDRGLQNARFQQGSVYELPFPDSSFDAVFSNGLLEHLSEPERALLEFVRVLKSPGVVGVRSPDYRGDLLVPADPGVLECMEQINQFRNHQGGNVQIGSDIMRLLRKSGFVDVEVGAAYVCFASMDTSTTAIGNPKRQE